MKIPKHLPSAAEAKRWWHVPDPRRRFLAYYRCLRDQHALTAAEALFLARRVARRYPEMLIHPEALVRQSLGLRPSRLTV